MSDPMRHPVLPDGVRRFRWSPAPKEPWIQWKKGDPKPTHDITWVYVGPKDLAAFLDLLHDEFDIEELTNYEV
jgi:hypothetical protein